MKTRNEFKQMCSERKDFWTIHTVILMFIQQFFLQMIICVIVCYLCFNIIKKYI